MANILLCLSLWWAFSLHSSGQLISIGWYPEGIFAQHLPHILFYFTLFLTSLTIISINDKLLAPSVAIHFTSFFFFFYHAGPPHENFFWPQNSIKVIQNSFCHCSKFPFIANIWEWSNISKGGGEWGSFYGSTSGVSNSVPGVPQPCTV